MASRDVVVYKTPLSRIWNIFTVIFIAFYLLWTLLPLMIMFFSSFKDLLAAFQLPPVGAFSKL
jgi:multiple sugar transport system permease protein